MHIINQEVNTAVLWRVALQLLFLPLLWIFMKFFSESAVGFACLSHSLQCNSTLRFVSLQAKDSG